MSNIEKLKAKLNSVGARLGGVSLGPKQSTAEEIAGELLRVLECMERGEYEPVPPERAENADLSGLSMFGVAAHTQLWLTYHERVAERDEIRAAWLAKQGDSQ